MMKICKSFFDMQLYEININGLWFGVIFTYNSEMKIRWSFFDMESRMRLWLSPGNYCGQSHGARIMAALHLWKLMFEQTKLA